VFPWSFYVHLLVLFVPQHDGSQLGQFAVRANQFDLAAGADDLAAARDNLADVFGPCLLQYLSDCEPQVNGRTPRHDDPPKATGAAVTCSAERVARNEPALPLHCEREESERANAD